VFPTISLGLVMVKIEQCYSRSELNRRGRRIFGSEAQSEMENRKNQSAAGDQSINHSTMELLNITTTTQNTEELTCIEVLLSIVEYMSLVLFVVTHKLKFESPKLKGRILKSKPETD
jgi:hypothetical protein